MTGKKGKTPSDGIELEGLRSISQLYFQALSDGVLQFYWAILTPYSESAVDLTQLISLFSRSVLLVYKFLRWFYCWFDWEMAIQRLFVMSSTVTYNDRAVTTWIVKWYRKIRYRRSSDVMAPFKNWTVAFPPTVLDAMNGLFPRRKSRSRRLALNFRSILRITPSTLFLYRDCIASR